MQYKEYVEKMKDVAIRLESYYETTKGKGKVWTSACRRFALEAKALMMAYRRGAKKK